MDNRFLKIAGFVALIVALTAAFRFVTREHLGAPDESRRVRHPDGFSIIGPQEWVGSILQTGKVRQPMLRFVPEVNMGIQPSLLAIRSDKPFELPGGKDVRENARPTQFQGQPATYYSGNEQNAWMFVLDFQRGSDHFRISLKLPVPDDVHKSVWWTYFETFRMETPMTPRDTTQPTSMPSLVVPKPR